MIKEEFLRLLACPICKGDLEYVEAKNALLCIRCRLLYPIEDGIPLLTKDHAEPLEEHH